MIAIIHIHSVDPLKIRISKWPTVYDTKNSDHIVETHNLKPGDRIKCNYYRFTEVYYQGKILGYLDTGHWRGPLLKSSPCIFDRTGWKAGYYEERQHIEISTPRSINGKSILQWN
jgi:hypothetical protein